jgi:hypothetical protein
MGKKLSAGFDIAGVFSEATINTVFQLAYSGGLLPIRASTEFSHLTGKHKLELYFLPPTLQFVALPNVQNPVKLRFPFLAQVPTMNAQGTGALAVFVTASKLPALDENNKEFHYVVLDFSTVPVNQYQFEPEGPPNLPYHAAMTFDVLDPNVVQKVAVPLAKSVLANGISKIPITPRVPSNFGFFTFRTYVDQNFVLPPNGTWYTLPRVLGAYVNQKKVEAEAPAKPPLQLAQNVIPHPHIAKYIWGEADELKVAIPEPLIKAQIQKTMDEKGWKPGATINISPDEEVTLNEIDVKLANGHLLVTGNADDVDFTLKIALSIENDHLQSIVIDKDFDVPWYLDLFQIFLPFVNTAIVDSIKLSIAKGLDSVGGSAGDLLDGISVFSNDLPGVQLAQLLIHNNGPIEISTGGLVLRGQVETLLGESNLDQPFYVYGHLHSKEFHRKGKGCPFLTKMKAKNTILFLSPAKALSMGYNGCRFCYLDYDVATVGQILIHFREPNPNPAQGNKRTLSLWFKLIQPVSLDSEEPKPQFKLDRSYNGHLEDDGFFYFNDSDLPDFLPGTWQLDVKMGVWSTSCEVTVKKWGKLSGKNTFLTFTVGEQGCGKAFGNLPPYPAS